MKNADYKASQREEEKMEKWHKPKLIVMARSNPEEFILSNCKTIVGPGASTATQTQCLDDFIDTCNYYCLDHVSS